MIFGTGAHASTQMCMRELEHYIRGGERVLDLGSGSGILSITALLLGAASAVGVDIDPKAEDIARENAGINQLHSDRFTALTGDVIDDRSMSRRLGDGYDIVLANIVADVIMALAPHVPSFLKPGGVFICSGILDRRYEDVRAALERAGLRILSTDTQDDWRRITAVPC
jgi:ribosomal protein L11 methyltransferase